MSRGMPSMTALLGMLAIAGYQNRDKLADLFRNATSGQPSGAKDSLGGMLGNLGGLVGGGGVGSLLNSGIGELLEHFKQNGQGDAAQSWINQGPNREVTPPELQQAIGPDVLQKLQQQTGLSQQEILDRLSRELPGQRWTNTRRTDVFRRNPRDNHSDRERDMGIIWTIIIGFIAGIIAKFIMPGDNEPSGFILTTILGIVGAFVATYLGQALGWYRPGEGAGLVGAVVGAIIVLLVYGFVAGRSRRAI
ncbi:uncharacterized protein YidB (DUF937 family)/uncharacterized membrane protein YeaQ/YmgE (transglycosylase-associated protein family) [Bradyrhizobium sp. GM22.5]